MKHNTYNQRPPRIAFADLSQANWVAGAHYLKNLFVALKSLEQPEQPEITLVRLAQAQPAGDTMFDSCAAQRLEQPAPTFWQRVVLRLQRQTGLALGPEPALTPLLRAHCVDAFFATIDFGPRFNLPLLAWIPDFQHIHLPYLFPKEELELRNRTFARIARYAQRVILSSHDALRDFERFAPQFAHKGRVLHFVAQVPANVYDSNPAWIWEQYQLPERFVYLPNQFWKHKNHEVVVKALALLKATHPEITVVCTGNTQDTRDPTHFSQLKATIEAEGLSKNFIILGMVPYSHIFQLMRQALAVLQPSLFEGWSTTVEETKSIGKQIILSDIPVHQEQSPPNALYFDPQKPDELAGCLIDLFAIKSPGPDYALETLARQQLLERTQVFGRAFVEIFDEVKQR
jgi:glycosyltransferase involved in cell wall biosynthesis